MKRRELLQAGGAIFGAATLPEDRFLRTVGFGRAAAAAWERLSTDTRTSIDAYVKNQTERRVGGPEPGYEENLKRMRAELAECEKKKAANPTGGFHYGRI